MLTEETQYCYDTVWKDRLVKIVDAQPDNGTQVKKDIRYDPNNPSNPIFYGNNNSGISYNWEGRNLIAYNRSSDGLQVNYEYGFVDCKNNNEYYYYRDVFGNINGIIDYQGTLVVKYEYDAYGNELSVAGLGNDV